MRSSTPGTGLPTVSARNGFKSLSVTRRACLGEPIRDDDRNAEVIKKLHRGRLDKRTSSDNRQQLTAKRFMHLRQQPATQLHSRTFLRQRSYSARSADPASIASAAATRRTSPAVRAPDSSAPSEPAHIGDLVTHKRIANKLRPQRPQMHNARPAHKRSDKSDHEINRMIRRQNA